MLEQCSPCVRLEGDPTFGQAKKTKAVSTGLWLSPIGVYRTRPVAILEELDLSRIDRTLGGSVRSLPPERPVSRLRAVLGLFSVSFSNPRVSLYIVSSCVLFPTSAPPPCPKPPDPPRLPTLAAVLAFTASHTSTATAAPLRAVAHQHSATLCPSDVVLPAAPPLAFACPCYHPTPPATTVELPRAILAHASSMP